MIAGGSHIEPTVGGAEKGVRTCSHRHVLGSLWDPDLKPGCAGSAAETSRGVLTLHRSNRIHIHRGRDVIVPPLIESAPARARTQNSPHSEQYGVAEDVVFPHRVHTEQLLAGPSRR